MSIPFRLLEVTRLVVDEVNDLIARSRNSLLHVDQLRRSLQSIAANIREARGRRPGPERNQFLRYAISSSEEADEHLRVNMVAHRIRETQFWRFHHRLVVGRKMIETLMGKP